MADLGVWPTQGSGVGRSSVTLSPTADTGSEPLLENECLG